MYGKTASRGQRYVRSWLLGMAVIWAAATAYLVLTPRHYTSSFTFVLPGTGAGSSLNLNDIGQASSTSDSAFSTPDISPTENYREILLSDRVLALAADNAKMAETAFPKPRIDLVAQTKLITVKVKARSADQAQALANDLSGAFLATLDDLRGEELQARNQAAMSMLAANKAALEDARARLTSYQVESGLVSAVQYNDMVGAIETLRTQLRGVQAQEAQAQAGVAGLTQLLGITPGGANQAMMLAADPLFQAELNEYAKNEVSATGTGATRGDADPNLQDETAQRDAAAAQLLARARQITGKPNVVRLTDPNLSLRDDRAQLFQRLVGNVADLDALQGGEAQLQAQISTQQQRVVELSPVAAKLDELQTNVQVAEAVFASGLARIGTNKADFFASYPLVQTLQAPTLPESPSSPKLLFGLAGALAGTFFLTLALVMTWLRTHLLHKILKNELSTLP